MNIDNEMSRAAVLCDGIGTFYEDEEFMEHFKGVGIFKAVGILLKKYPDICVDMVCAYDGVDRDLSGITYKNIFGKMVKILTDKEILEVFQSAE